jgi:hypothetical protein
VTVFNRVPKIRQGAHPGLSATGRQAAAIGKGGSSAHLYCAIDAHTFQSPTSNAASSDRCGNEKLWFNMQQGMEPLVVCDGDGTITGPLLHRPGLWTLGYGQSLGAGAIACDSETTGMTCTDSSTGHYFHISQESYEIG